jgi:hypothetical protein
LKPPLVDWIVPETVSGEVGVVVLMPTFPFTSLMPELTMVLAPENLVTWLAVAPVVVTAVPAAAVTVD